MSIFETMSRKRDPLKEMELVKREYTELYKELYETNLYSLYKIDQVTTF